MSLREEIKKSLIELVDNRELCKIYEVTINEIISKIEKRIDSMPSRFEYKEIEFAMGFAEACLKIKEMLKS